MTNTPPFLSESEVEAIEARMNKTPEGPWFAAADTAKECGPHRDSGLALVDTGRESDWPIARLCEWHKARFIAHSREDMGALIRDWRALRKMLDDTLVRAAEDQDYDSEQRATIATENVALREQLGQLANFARHADGCEWWDAIPRTSCSCGLANIVEKIK